MATRFSPVPYSRICRCLRGYAFDTILPGAYKLGDSFRPAHIHFMVSAAGFRPIVTQLYFSGDRYLQPNDPCGVCASGDRTLIIDLSAGAAGVKQGNFGIVLASA